MKHLIAAVLLLSMGVMESSAIDASDLYSQKAYEKGSLDAAKDLNAGKYRIETYGYPAEWIVEYNSILKEKYKIETFSVAGCMVDDVIIGHALGYNKVMEKDIRKAYGDDVFDRTEVEAQKLHGREAH